VHRRYAKARDDFDRYVARDDYRDWVKDLKETATEVSTGVWRFPDGSELQLVPLPKPRRHKWPPRAECTGQTKCLNGCGTDMDSYKYDRIYECEAVPQGDPETANV